MPTGFSSGTKGSTNNSKVKYNVSGNKIVKASKPTLLNDVKNKILIN